jgi:hypothetical protein
MSTELAVNQETQVATVPQAGGLLGAISRAASDPAMDMDKVERLFAMQQALQKQQAETAFNGALARAQSHIVPVAHNAKNDQTNSKYAKLAAINKAITPIYTAEGFSVSFDTADSPKDGYLRTVATLSHAEGHSRQYHLDMPPDEMGAKGTVNKTKVHATGSTSSYARRYLVCMIFNVTTEDDADGNGRAKGMPDGQLADFHEAIAQLTDDAAAISLWEIITQACIKSRDVEANNGLRSAMLAKRKELKK